MRTTGTRFFEIAMTTVKDLLISIGQQLKTERNKSKVTISTHCKGNYETPTNYCNFENGNRTMSLKKLIELADGHNCNVVISLVSRASKNGDWGHASS